MDPVRKLQTNILSTNKLGEESPSGLSNGAEQKNGKAWVVSVSMGYGHQRTAYPLRHLAPDDQIINANDYEGIPQSDRRIWETNRQFYEFISNFKRIPLIGDFFFGIFDKFQKILSYYPKRDLSKPNLLLKQLFSTIKKGWGRHLIEKLVKSRKEKPLPLITTFFTPAFMAEFFNYPGNIYCVICDADISRSWVSLNPQQSRIKYFAPNHRVVYRLGLYGVKKENIFLTGYPLPKENLGSQKLEILKDDFGHRLLNLDPRGIYCKQYSPLIKNYVGDLPLKTNHPLTIMFAIGGAGAQKEIAISVVKSLSKKIKTEKVKIILVAGIKTFVKEFFLKKIEDLGLKNSEGIEILYAEKINEYFKKFNEALRTTDVLWTKPSELSFYTSLGIPIIISPSIGSQEDFNREWLLRHNSGIPQENPNYTDEWLFDYLSVGWLANAAMHGFIETEKHGIFNIEKIIEKNELVNH